MPIDCIQEAVEFPAIDNGCEAVRVCAESENSEESPVKPGPRKDKFISNEQTSQDENQNIPLSNLILGSLIKGAARPFINLAKGDLKTWGVLLTAGLLVTIFPPLAMYLFVGGIVCSGIDLVFGTVGLISAHEKGDKKEIAKAAEDLGGGIAGIATSFIAVGQCAAIARVTKLRAGITPSARTGFISNCKEISSMFTSEGRRAIAASCTKTGIKATLNMHKFRFETLIGIKPSYSWNYWFGNLKLFFGGLLPPLNTYIASTSAPD